MKATKILVGIDLGETSEMVMNAAIDLAAQIGPAELHAVYVSVPPVEVLNAYALPPPPTLAADVQKLTTFASEEIKKSIERHGALKIRSVTAHGAIGAPAQELARLAAQLDVDLVVVGTHGRRGLERAFLGSVSEKAVRLCGCPVVVVRPKHHTIAEKIPEIEPLCPDCAQARFDTKGAQLWCSRHASHHPHAHVYSYDGPSSTSIRPWGFAT